MEKHVAYIKLDLICLYPYLPYWKNKKNKNMLTDTELNTMPR